MHMVTKTNSIVIPKISKIRPCNLDLERAKVASFL